MEINIDTVYNEIIEKLRSTNNFNIIDDLERSSMGAATGSEALMEQGSYLLLLRNNDPDVFTLIEEHINTYLKYCRQNGLMIR